MVHPDIVAAFARKGVLRASINVGNPILAKRDPATGSATGVSVDLASAFAARLGVPLELVVFDSAGESAQAVGNEQADIGFFAIDPKRGETVSFTDAYVLIEGCYMVRDDSPLQDNGEVDQAGTVVTVGKGSAYDLYLSRSLRHATILRAPTSPTVTSTFLAEKADVAAGVRQQLQADAQKHGGLRLLPGRFMEIRQAMGTPKSRGDVAANALHEFVEDMKSSGFVAQALARHDIQGAAVAPASA